MSANNDLQARDALARQLASSSWRLKYEALKSIDLPTLQFMALELADPNRTYENYIQRIEFLGLKGSNLVLDYGCGVGQWSLALAKFNKTVVGIDKNSSRIQTAKLLAGQACEKSITFTTEEADVSAFADGSFDAVFCYSTLMFLDAPVALGLFNRLLRPGGKLYVMVDLPAWHIKSLMQSIKNWPGIAYLTARTILGRRRNIVYTQKTLKLALEEFSFKVISDGCDGQASFNSHSGESTIEFPEFLLNKFWGMQTLYEVCAEKTSP